MATPATENSAPRYRDDDLVTFCEALYKARGMREDIAAISACILVEAD